MRNDRELLEDALCLIDSGTKGGMAYDITREIRARLEEPEPEPVAWAAKQGMVSKFKQWEDAEPLYRHPPRQMVRLSNTEIRCIVKNVIPDVTVAESVTFRAVARAIEQAVLEKNR